MLITEDIIREKYKLLAPSLNEKSRRLWAASEAIAFGRGGILTVCRATGLSNNTVYKGIAEIKDQSKKTKQELKIIRQPGGGRKKLIEQADGLEKVLDNLIEPATRGDPESVLRWTSKSLVKLEKALKDAGYQISYRTVGRLLKSQGYTLQSNRKRYEGSNHPDRDKQFDYIYEKTKTFLREDAPVISVDTKKKELIGNFKNNGREWQEKTKPVEVEAYDFLSKSKGKISPYGVYDLGKNKGWVSVGISKDTAEFAVNTIRTWWTNMGKLLYPKATKLLITADCGGSNGNRVRLWKLELQKLANETNLNISVAHFPPGTSKWNKIEHRLFSYISNNWRGKPLINTETVINLICNTRTKKGLEVKAVLDNSLYEKGISISKKVMESISIYHDNFHPEWNYTISPNFN